MNEPCLDPVDRLQHRADAAGDSAGPLHRHRDGRPACVRRPHRGPVVSPVRHQARRRDGLAAVRAGHPAVQCPRRAGGLCAAAPAAVAAAEPAGHGQRVARLVVQHRGQLRHQHQLAGLRRRADDELPDPDAGPGGAELPVRRHRHRRRHRADPRLRAPFGQGHRQRLGRPDPRDALDPAADLVRLRAVPRAAGRGAELRCLQGSADARGRQVPGAQGRGRRPAAEERQGRAGDGGQEHRQADAGDGPGRFADRDQDARHQRRRLLQRQRGASVREPDAAVQLRPDAVDLPDRRRAVPDLRPHGRQDQRQGWTVLHRDVR